MPKAAASSKDFFDITFVRIEPGKFIRGTTKEQLQRILDNENWQADETLLADELPAREITITKAFEMSATEITQAQYQQVMGTNPSTRQGDKLPVVMVRYSDCVEFCRRLSEKTGRTIRLPTEAEWEYASRAGSISLWCFGDEEERLEDYAWYDWNALNGMMPVGTLKPNAWGLFDMHGNVWEWCSDFYSETYYADSPTVDPTGPESGSAHVVRGGYFFSPGWQTRCAERDSGGSIIEPGETFARPNLGFRIVREIEDSPR